MPFLNNNDKPSFLKANLNLSSKNQLGPRKIPEIKKSAPLNENKLFSKPQGSIQPKAPTKKDFTIFGDSSEKSRYQIEWQFKNSKEVQDFARKQGMPVWKMAKKLVEEGYPEKYGAGLRPEESKVEAKNDFWEIKAQIRETINDPKAYKETRKREARIKFLQKRTGQKPY